MAGGGAVQALIAPGQFSDGWMASSPILGSAQGIWDLGKSGSITLSNPSGFNGSVNTKDGLASADNGQGNVFTVDVQCGNTIVSTQSGRVELRAGSTVKQIAAGSQDSAGQPATGSGCGAGPGEPKHIGAATIAGILLAAGGVIATAILLGQDDSERDIFGGVVDPSPVR